MTLRERAVEPQCYQWWPVPMCLENKPCLGQETCEEEVSCLLRIVCLLVLVYFPATPSWVIQVLRNQTASVDIWQHTVICVTLVERRPFRCQFEYHTNHFWISSPSPPPPPPPLVHGVPETNHVYKAHNFDILLTVHLNIFILILTNLMH